MLLSRINSLRHNERGQAMLMVLAMMMLMGLAMAIIVSGTVFSVYFTTQNRASVESTAAAQAGIEEVGAAVLANQCGAPGSVVNVNGKADLSDSTPAYTAQVYRIANAGMTAIAGCPQITDYGFKVVSTGYAHRVGAPGFDGGDEKVLEALWVEPVKPPSFDHAVRGDSFVGSKAQAKITSATGDADIYTEGDTECPAGARFEGSLIVGGNVDWRGSNCVVTGDVIVAKDFFYNQQAAADPHIEGNLTVLGNIKDLPTATTSRVDMGWQTYLHVAGLVRAGGWIHNYCWYPGAEWPPPAASLENYETGWGGRECKNIDVPGGQERAKMYVPNLEFPDQPEFPIVNTDTKPWADYETRSFTDSEITVNTDANSGRCGWYTATSGGSITVTENTRIDNTGVCTETNLSNLVLNLGADLVIYSERFHMNGNVTINSTDGRRHDLYLISPAPAGFTGCPPTSQHSSVPDKFNFSAGAWNQDPQINVLAYTTDKINVGRDNFTFGGQFYSCVTEMQDGLHLDFRKVGEDDSRSGMARYEVSYIRQG